MSDSGPTPPSSCPCDSGAKFAQCCGIVINDARGAVTAEALMRSRYSAYVLGEREHLLRTWAPETRPAKLFIDPARRWLGLKIKATTRGQAGDTSGTVEFVARSKVAGKADRVHEVSEFRFDDEGWLYVSGVVD